MQQRLCLLNVCISVYSQRRLPALFINWRLTVHVLDGLVFFNDVPFTFHDPTCSQKPFNPNGTACVDSRCADTNLRAK